MSVQLKPMNQNEKRKVIVWNILHGFSSLETGKKCGTSSAYVKVIFLREMKKVVTEEDWAEWLLIPKPIFKSMTFDFFKQRKEKLFDLLELRGPQWDRSEQFISTCKKI